MATQFEEGRYQVRIVNQRLTKSKLKGTLEFTLDFRVLHNLDQPELSVKSYQRDTTLWITDKTAKRVLHELHVLGYAGRDLRGVDPDTEGFHNFRDQEIELVCVHESNGGGEIFERWNLQSNKANLQDKSLRSHFDCLLNGEPERVNGGAEVMDHGLTDDDVPF
jgi:hypothetical protein